MEKEFINWWVVDWIFGKTEEPGSRLVFQNYAQNHPQRTGLMNKSSQTQLPTEW